MLTYHHRATPNYGHQIVTGPVSEPISVEELRALLRNPPTTENAFIETCAIQARLTFEAVTGIACIAQTWKLTLDHWPRQSDYWWEARTDLPVAAVGDIPEFISLPRFPLISVAGVKTFDEADVETLTDLASVFFVDTVTLPGRLCLRTGQNWPVYTRRASGIEIVYTAGFLSTPENIKRAIQQLAVFYYEHRGDGCDPSEAFNKSGALQFAAEYVMVRL